MPLLTLAFALLLVMPSWAVTLDTVTVAQKTGTGTTLTQSHTVTSSGGNRIFCLLCSLRSTTITVTATYGGQAMSSIRAATVGGATENYLLYLINPPTGSNSWVATMSSALSMICHGISATDVNQGSPFTSSSGTSGSTTASSLTLTVGSNDLVLDLLSLNIEGAATTPGANQTSISGLPLESSGTTLTHAGSQQSGADGGVMTYSWTGGAQYAYSAFALSHAAFSASSFGPLKRRF